MLPSLIAEKFTLRALRKADATAIAAACVDAEIVRWCVSVPLGYTEETALAFVDYTRVAALNGSELVWGIDVSGVFAGIVSLFDIGGGSAEVGFWMAPVMRGQGILTVALGMVVGFAFDPQGLGLDSVGWTAIEGNLASERVAQKVGFADFRTVPGGTFGRSLPGAERPLVTVRKASLTRQRWAELAFPV